MSSLFGGTTSNTNTGGSLFGGAATSASNAPTNNAAPGKSLFDRISLPTASTSAATPSLFGTTTTTAPATGGLFGATAQPAASTGNSLFAGLNTTSAPTSTPSLFGGANTAAQPSTAGKSLFGSTQPAPTQPAASGTSLFGGMNSTAQPAASTSLFGGTNTNAQPAASTSLFGSSIAPAANAGQVQTFESGPVPANPSYFDQLLERGRKRQTEEHITLLGDLPPLELGLADISRKVRRLGEDGPSSSLARNGDYTKAHYLLSASGVNTGRALRDLDALTGVAQPLYEHELDGLSGIKRDIARKHRSDFQEMLDNHIAAAHDDFNKMIDEQLHGVDWLAHRQRIYEHFGLKKPQSMEDKEESGAFGRSRKGKSFGASAHGKSFGLSGLNKSVIGAAGLKNGRQSQFGDVSERIPTDGWRAAPEDRASRVKQEKYAERVKDLNVARIQVQPYDVLQQFSNVESEQPGENTDMLLNAYRALQMIVEEGHEAIKERQYAKAYLNDAPSSQANTAVRKRILDGSRRFLEGQFLTQLEHTVAKNPREANVGGIPTVVAKVKGYVRVRAARRELGADVERLQEVDGDYCWAVIYYLLRSGLLKDALAYVDQNANAFRHIDRKFMSYLRHYVDSPERRLSHRDQTEIHNDYSQRAKLAPEDSIDPYRMMCYKVIGRCDLARRIFDNKINSDMMDFLWLQFTLAREYNRVDELAHEAYGLDEVRATFKDIGERYFGPNSDIPNAPTTFFFMQLLAGSFEKAVADLYPHNYVSAVHVAIALDYYGLLRVSDIKFSDDLLSYTTRQQAQIAFGSMIGLYTGDFRIANSTAAADYIALICLNADLDGDMGRGQRELCHQALSELVLETREYAQLLGDIRDDGQRVKGAIELRLQLIGLEDEQEFLRQITLNAARTADDNGRTNDAALLFHLAEDYDRVIVIVSDALSLVLTTDIGEQPPKLIPLKPRTSENGQELPAEQQGSLSLAAVDDPVKLAQNFNDLYFSREMFYKNIRTTSRDCINILLGLARARQAFEAGQWTSVIDYVNNAGVVPSEARGNMALIRSKANAFNEMPTVVARTIGHVMVWVVVACHNHAESLRRSEYSNPAQQEILRTCVATAKDVMLFAGLIRYKLPGRVWETLARIGQELGAY